MSNDNNYNEFKSGFYDFETDLIIAIKKLDFSTLKTKTGLTAYSEGYNAASNYFSSFSVQDKKTMLEHLCDMSTTNYMIEMFYNKNLFNSNEDLEYSKWHMDFSKGRFDIVLACLVNKVSIIRKKDESTMSKGYLAAVNIYLKNRESEKIFNQVEMHRSMIDIDRQLYEERVLSVYK